MIFNRRIDVEKKAYAEVDTVTLYLGPQRQTEYYDYILSLAPKRVIFNPGTENEDFARLLAEHGIEAEEACTLVLLASGQYWFNLSGLQTPFGNLSFFAKRPFGQKDVEIYRRKQHVEQYQVESVFVSAEISGSLVDDKQLQDTSEDEQRDCSQYNQIVSRNYQDRKSVV